MKKILLAQLVLLGLVIIIGALLKGSLGSDALRTGHKLVGATALLVGIASVVASFINKTSLIPKVLLGATVLAIILAGNAGKMAVSGKGVYSSSFNTMRIMAVMAFVATAGAYYIATKSSVKTKPTADTQND